MNRIFSLSLKQFLLILSLLTIALTSCNSEDTDVFSLVLKNDTNYKMRVEGLRANGGIFVATVPARQDSIIKNVLLSSNAFEGPAELMSENFEKVQIGFSTTAFDDVELSKDKSPVNCTENPFKDDDVWTFEDGQSYVVDEMGYSVVRAKRYTFTLSSRNLR